MNRLQSRLEKVEAELGNTAAKMYVTAAPADRCAEDVLRELGIALGERDQHVHLRKFFGAGSAQLISTHARGY